MKLVIRPDRPIRKIFVYLTFFLALGLVFLFSIDYGHWRSSARELALNSAYKALLVEVRKLSGENAKLHKEIAKLNRAEEISAHLREENHTEMVRLQDKVALLSGELDFYRDIVRSSEVDNGPKVRGFRIKNLQGEGRFGYKIVMTFINKQHKYAEGKLNLVLLGELEGVGKSINFQEVVESGEKSFKFKFKHFHLFEGTIRLPERFAPLQIQVLVDNKKGRKYDAENTFDWASILN